MTMPVTALDLRRMQAGFKTQKLLADALGCDQTHLSRVCRGLWPTREFAEKLCGLLADRIDDPTVTPADLVAELFPVVAEVEVG